MVRVRKWGVAFTVFALGAAWAGLSLTAQEPKPGAKAGKSVDLSALREAIATASRRGENVDEIRTALDAFEKALPNAPAGGVPPELQTLRDAVDAAARKGENVEAITKELLAIEMAVAGKSLARPKPEPIPDPDPASPNPDLKPPFPNGQFLPNPGAGAGGVDFELLRKAMELRRKALQLKVQNPRDAEAQKEARKLDAEANELMMKAMRNAGGGARIAPGMAAFPDVGRVADRARLGIRLERVPALAVEQLGLDPDTGIAVSFVSPGSAAEKAGLKVHDIVLEFAGQPVTVNMDDFIRRVNGVKTGEKVDLVVLRKGKKVDVKGVELPEPAKQLQPQPLPDFQLPDLFPDQPKADPALRVPGVRPALPKPIGLPPGFNSVSYTTTNDEFTLRAVKGGIKYGLSGTFDGAGNPAVSKVTVEQDGRVQTHDATAKLPADLQADVESLLKTIELRK